MTITVQEQLLKDIIEQTRTIKDLSFIAEKGDAELNYAAFRIRVQTNQIVQKLRSAVNTAKREEGQECTPA